MCHSHERVYLYRMAVYVVVQATVIRPWSARSHRDSEAEVGQCNVETGGQVNAAGACWVCKNGSPRAGGRRAIRCLPPVTRRLDPLHTIKRLHHCDPPSVR
jgi:hypothetical protein